MKNTNKATITTGVDDDDEWLAFCLFVQEWLATSKLSQKEREEATL